MARKVTIAYTVFSILAFIALISWLAAAFYQIKSENLINATNTFQDVRRSVAATLAKEGRFDTTGFRDFVHSLFLEDPMIDVLSVTTQAGDVQYIFARHTSDLAETRVSDRQWSGAIRYNKATQYMFSSPLALPTVKPQLIVQTVFTTVRRQDLYALARITLICLIAFVILTGIVILIIPLLGRNDGSFADRKKASVPPRHGQPPETPVSGRTPVGEPGLAREPIEPPASGMAPHLPSTADERGESPQAAPRAVEKAAEASGPTAHEPAPQPRVPDGEIADTEGPAEALSSEAMLHNGASSGHHPEEDELPPGIRLPSLEAVSTEQPPGYVVPDEISLFEELRERPDDATAAVRPSAAPRLPSVESQGGGQPVGREPGEGSEAEEDTTQESSTGPSLIEVTEIQEPPREAGEIQGTSTSGSVAEELSDIEDFEDLEEIDGHGSPEPHKPKPERSQRQATGDDLRAEDRPQSLSQTAAAARPAAQPDEEVRDYDTGRISPSPKPVGREPPAQHEEITSSRDAGSSDRAEPPRDEGEELPSTRAEEQAFTEPDLSDVEALELTEEEDRELAGPDLVDVEAIELSEEEERDLLEPDLDDLEPLAEPDLDDVEALEPTEEEERELPEPDLHDLEPLAESDLDDVEALELTEEEERELLEPDLDDVEVPQFSEEEERELAELGRLESAGIVSSGTEEPGEAVPVPSGERATVAAPDMTDQESHDEAPGSSERRDASRELFDPETGLAWEEHLEQRLSFELDRAAAFDQDLSVCIIRIARREEGFDRLNYARDIRTSFPFHDLCFEYGRDGFAIVLPNTDIDQAIRAMENFEEKLAEKRTTAPRMVIGLSARNGRLLAGERLLKEAETALLKARQDRKNTIFALRVDPGKYREFIKSTLR